MKKRCCYIVCTMIWVSWFVTALADNTNVGTLAGNLNVPISVARYFLSGGCYVLGAAFLVATFFRYMRFRQNSQEAPISSVIILLVIGVVLIILPFSYQMTNRLSTEYGVQDVVSS